MNQEILRSLETKAEKETLDLPCSLDDADYTPIFNENLVKLTIQECIDTVLDCSVEYATRPRIAQELKEHFGIES